MFGEKLRCTIFFSLKIANLKTDTYVSMPSDAFCSNEFKSYGYQRQLISYQNSKTAVFANNKNNRKKTILSYVLNILNRKNFNCPLICNKNKRSKDL